MEILILLMPFFIEWLESCQESRSRESIEEGLNNPGILERFAIWIVFRKHTKLRRKALRLEVDDAMKYLREAEPEDIQMVMAAVPMLPSE